MSLVFDSIGVKEVSDGKYRIEINPASGFGAVIAALPGFQAVNTAVSNAIRDPQLNVAATVNALSAITGSSSGGLSLALAATGRAYLEMPRESFSLSWKRRRSRLRIASLEGRISAHFT